MNDYPTVARAVERKYPDVRFAWSHFKSSEASMQFIQRSIDEQLYRRKGERLAGVELGCLLWRSETRKPMTRSPLR